MSYRFEADEIVSEGVKRIATEQNHKAFDRLKAQRISRDEAIHDARVCFKKLRALLRLVRGEIGKDVYEQENACYRDVGRRLSAVRDTAAMVEAIDKLAGRFAAQLADDSFGELRAALRKSKRKRQAEKKKALSGAARAIKTARQRIEDWPINGDEFPALGQGLKRVYKQGRVGFANAYGQADVGGFHEWRKQVKYLMYHVRIIRPIWRGMLGELADELKKLAGYLSDIHDLAILRQKIIEQAGESSNGRELEVLVALIDQRCEELQIIAKPLGERIYAEKPKEFLDRLQGYWRAWRLEAKADPIAKQL